MNKRVLLIAIAAGTALAGACNDSNDRQANPSFTTAGTKASTAGTHAGGNDDGVGFGGNGTGTPAAGNASTTPGGAPSAETGGQPNSAEGGGAEAGAAGAAPEVPPYDCVLHPKTHLEIINACTDATRIEKHPGLPAIP